MTEWTDVVAFLFFGILIALWAWFDHRENMARIQRKDDDE